MQTAHRAAIPAPPRHAGLIDAAAELLADVPGAVPRFYRLARPVVVAACRAVAPHHPDIDDAAQEALIRAFRYRHDLSEPDLVVGWLYRIAQRETYRVLGRRRPDGSPLDQTAAVIDLSRVADPTHVIQVQDARDDVAVALEPLSERDRRLLFSHHVDGVPIAELAAQEGLSPEYVKWLLSQLRRRCRETLEATRSHLLLIATPWLRRLSSASSTLAPALGALLLLIPGVADLVAADSHPSPAAPAAPTTLLATRVDGVAARQAPALPLDALDERSKASRPTADSTADDRVMLIGVAGVGGITTRPEPPSYDVRIAVGHDGQAHHTDVHISYPSVADPLWDHVDKPGPIVVEIDPR